MIKIVNFRPERDKKANLKDNISFRIAALAPFDRQFPNREVSKLEDQGTFKRLSFSELQTKVDQGSLLYRETATIQPNVEIINGDVGLVPATDSQLQQQLNKGLEDLSAKRAELSSLVYLSRREPNVDQGEHQKVPDRIFFANKGKVLDICEEDSFPYLFLGNTRFSNVIEVINGNQIKVANSSLLTDLQQQFLTIVNVDITGSNFPNSIRNVYVFKIGNVVQDRILLNETDFSSELTLREDDFVDPNDFNAEFTYLFKPEEIEAINASSLFYAIPGLPLLRNQSIGQDIPTLQEYCDLIKAEIPKTNIFAPLGTDKQADSRFIGNLDVSSLNVALHDDDNTVLLIQNGEAQFGVSVQYKLNKESNLEENVEIGDVDVNISLSALPVRVSTRGSLVLGAQSIPLNIDIIASSNQEDATANEFYFNLQTQNSEGQSVSLNNYGTLRVFDKIDIRELKNGKLTTLQRNTVAAIDPDNNTIFLADPITTLPSSSSTVVVEIPQSPLNPGRKYRVVINCQDKEGAPQSDTNAQNRTEISPPEISNQIPGSTATALPPDEGITQTVPITSSTPGIDVVIPSKTAEETQGEE